MIRGRLKARTDREVRIAAAVARDRRLARQIAVVNHRLHAANCVICREHAARRRGRR